MKKILILLGILLMAISGCARQQDVSSENEIPEEGPFPEGGWEEVEDGTITSELAELFDQALAGLTGVSYKPLKLVATQVVSGTNYRFLCESTVIYPGADSKKVYVTIYKDISGKAEVIDICDADEGE